MNIYLIRLIQMSCLIAILYWGNGYKLNYVFWLASSMFIFVGLFSAFIQSKLEKENSKQ